MALYSCGSNSDGQLSHGSANTTDSAHFLRTSPALPGRPLALAFGARHTLLILTPPSTSSSPPINQLWACGSNFEGQLGLARPDASREAAVTEFRRLRLDQLGLAQLVEEGWEPVQVAACSETSFLVCRWTGSGGGKDDVVVVMGADDWGERGGAGNPQDGPQPISFSSDILVNTGLSGTVTRVAGIAAGPRHVVAVLERVDATTGQPTGWRRLVGWGAARQGQLGSGLVDHRGKALVKIAQTVEIRVEGVPLLVDGSEVVDLALGMEHTAILLRRVGPPAEPVSLSCTAQPTLILLGSSRKSQLGPSPIDNLNRLRLPLSDLPINATSTPLQHQLGACWSSTLVLSTCTLTLPWTLSKYSLFGFGSNHHSQLAQPSTTLLSAAATQPIELPLPPPGSTRQVRQLAAGSEHVLVLCTVRAAQDGEDTERDEVWAWGWNEHGNLGTADFEDGTAPRRVWPTAGHEGERVVGVWAGNATSWIATA